MGDVIEDETRPLISASVPDTEHKGCGSLAVCDPRRALHRYFVLIFICFLSFGGYYVYDNPAALQDVMLSDLKITTSQFTIFYALYSWPNVILCFFGGFLIDRVFGVRWGAIIFCVIVTIGQIIFAFGALIDAYWLMCVGRFVFGLGGENLGVAQNTYAVRWFYGRELNMVFGLQLSFARVGSTVNMYTMRPVYTALHEYILIGYQCLGATLFVGGAFCLLSVFCSLMMFYFDKRARRILQKDEQTTDEVIELKDIKYFGAKFWLLCVVCITYYVAVFPFISLALVFFENKYELDAQVANAVNSLVYFVSAVGSPVCGFGIDKLGRNIFWLLIGVIVTAVCHGIMAFTFMTPFVPMVVMGLAFSLVASALWPMVSYVIPHHQIGTAYGIMQSIQNLGLALVVMVNGIIVDEKGYFILEISMLAWLCAALIATVALYLVDAATGGLLNRSAKQRMQPSAQEVVTVDDGDE